jgi:hypothetical protein
MPAREVGITRPDVGELSAMPLLSASWRTISYLSSIVTTGYLLIRNGVLFILYIFLNSPTCLQLFHNIIRQGI